MGGREGVEVYKNPLELVIPLELDCKSNHLEGCLVQVLQSAPETHAHSPSNNSDVSSDVMSDVTSLSARQLSPAPPVPEEEGECSVDPLPVTNADPRSTVSSSQ